MARLLRLGRNDCSFSWSFGQYTRADRLERCGRGRLFGSLGSVLPDVVVTLFNQRTDEKQSTISKKEGLFVFLSLLPGKYELRASKADFEPLDVHEINVHVTETLRLELRLQLAKHFERAEVPSNALMIQADTSALGRLVNESAVSDLPMVNRNFTQIASLSRA